MLTQWTRSLCLAFAGVWLAAMARAASADGPCAAPVAPWQRLGAQVWWLPGESGDASAQNRGRVSALLAVHSGATTWLLGSGPSPRLSRDLACGLQAQAGWKVDALVNPWARPELVLGNRAWPRAALWAHADVAEAMARQCAHCEARLATRLGAAADDLLPAPAAEVARQAPAAEREGGGWLEGDAGTLGPWHWWRLSRAPGQTVTVWRLREVPLWSAPGLLWADGPPDLRDADLQTMRASLARLTLLARQDGRRARWLPEQGLMQGASAPQQSLDYLSRLLRAVQQRQDAGALETDLPATWPGLRPDWAQHERHALNWQRAWRQMESL